MREKGRSTMRAVDLVGFEPVTCSMRLKREDVDWIKQTIKVERQVSGTAKNGVTFLPLKNTIFQTNHYAWSKDDCAIP